MEDSFDEKLAHYIEIGAIEAAGIDESGEFIFAINESAQELAPELWQAHIDYVDQTMLELFDSGLLNVEYDENLEATIHLTKEGYEVAKEYGLINLDDE